MSYMPADPADAGAPPGTPPSASQTPEETASPPLEMRILVLAPTSNDARLTATFLTRAGLRAEVCADFPDFSRKLDVGCGAILLAEESLFNGYVHELVSKLETQPSWSDLPIVIITGTGESRLRSQHLADLAPAGNVSIIERPVRPGTLVSTLESALRSRRRQYQVRSLLEEREQMTAKALDADRRKDEFLAMLSHELRNPLASVTNAANLLKSPLDAETFEWAVGVVDRQTQQLALLIDDLLDVSRITSGKIRLRKEIIDASIILDRACESARPLIRERGHDLVCEFSRGAMWLEADPTRIEQIILNLLTNAAKYTPGGGRIQLSASRHENELFITVRDNGMGISPDKLPDMFQLFAQGERSIARSEGGLGIGLTIVQKLAEMHGGKVTAHSEGPNKGSTFTVQLPAVAPPVYATPNATSPAEAANGYAIRVLVVDDNVDTARGLAKLLTRAGHEIVLAHDGPQALLTARDTMPQAIVLDIGLPGMDGFEVAKRLRQEPHGSEALIIAVTGYGQDEDRQRALDAGFDHHLVKPVNLAELKRLLSGRA